MRLTVYTTHSRMVFTVSQLKLPFCNVFRETGSLLKTESCVPKGQHMWPMVYRSVCHTLRRFDSCAKEMKSSTKMSTYCKGCPVVGNDGSRASGGSTMAQELFS